MDYSAQPLALGGNALSKRNFCKYTVQPFVAAGQFQTELLREDVDSSDDSDTNDSQQEEAVGPFGEPHESDAYFNTRIGRTDENCNDRVNGAEERSAIEQADVDAYNKYILNQPQWTSAGSFQNGHSSLSRLTNRQKSYLPMPSRRRTVGFDMRAGGFMESLRDFAGSAARNVKDEMLSYAKRRAHDVAALAVDDLKLAAGEKADQLLRRLASELKVEHKLEQPIKSTKKVKNPTTRKFATKVSATAKKKSADKKSVARKGNMSSGKNKKKYY